MLTPFDKISSYFFNPTKKWPVKGRQELIYDLRSLSLNGYALNSKLEEAVPFGKCAFVKRMGKEFIDLYYPEAGFVLEFGFGILMGLRVVISKHSYLSKVSGIQVGKFSILDLNGRQHLLNAETLLQDLTVFLGEPVESDPVGEDMVHTFFCGKIFIESYHHIDTGRLLQFEISEMGDQSHLPQ